MKLAFLLSMPGSPSWNGKWSGEGRCYAVIKSVGRSQKAQAKAADLAGRSFSYRWSDGWVACVTVREVDAAEAQKLRKASVGFAGYEWMIDSIQTYERIMAPHEIKAYLEQHKNTAAEPVAVAT